MKDALKSDFFEAVIKNSIAANAIVLDYKPLGGGCINDAHKVVTSKGNFFVKYNINQSLDFFQKEFNGLQLLESKKIFPIPKPIAAAVMNDIPYIILENIDTGRPSKNYWQNFGANLAKLHKITTQKYGFHENNYIGSLPQYNSWEQDWTTFFIEYRLKKQIEAAKNNKIIGIDVMEKFEKLYSKLPEIITTEPPSLLHGDLWSGNTLVNDAGEACLIDPAVYYGHREAELAFTRLFGGFHDTFYASYQSLYPLHKGYLERFDIYNLYPLLVHVNIFGGSYLKSVLQIVGKYV
ncbi:MAG: fructosamine kinase family protein [Cytophagales bacterium]|nr:fructosamine kinase family protein [Cytophagales bacterium]